MHGGGYIYCKKKKKGYVCSAIEFFFAFLLFLIFFCLSNQFNPIPKPNNQKKNSIQGINTMANAFYFPQKLTEKKKNWGEGNNEEKGD